MALEPVSLDQTINPELEISPNDIKMDQIVSDLLIQCDELPGLMQRLTQIFGSDAAYRRAVAKQRRTRKPVVATINRKRKVDLDG